MDGPIPQELPQCHRHTDKKCPGECQYVLRHDQCIHEIGPDETELHAKQSQGC